MDRAHPHVLRLLCTVTKISILSVTSSPLRFLIIHVCLNLFLFLHNTESTNIAHVSIKAASPLAHVPLLLCLKIFENGQPQLMFPSLFLPPPPNTKSTNFAFLSTKMRSFYAYGLQLFCLKISSSPLNVCLPKKQISMYKTRLFKTAINTSHFKIVADPSHVGIIIILVWMG